MIAINVEDVYELNGPLEGIDGPSSAHFHQGGSSYLSIASAPTRTEFKEVIQVIITHLFG